MTNEGYAYRSRAQAGSPSVLEFLARTYPHSTLHTWAARLHDGEIEVNGTRITADQALPRGADVTWHRPPWTEPDAPTTFDLIYEDAHLLAVSKPAGLPTLPGGGFLNRTLLHVVRAHVGAPVTPLHRLGRGTSGAVLFARTSAAAAALSGAWRDGQVSKTYRALAAGHVQPGRHDLRTPIGPVDHPRLGHVHAANPAGRASHSVAWPLEWRAEPSPGCTLLDVELLTGRPHQIRIHLAAAGHPLVGDPLYAPGGVPLPDLPGLPGDLGYHLHSHTLTFRHPFTGTEVTVRAEPLGLLRVGDEGAAGAQAANSP